MGAKEGHQRSGRAVMAVAIENLRIDSDTYSKRMRRRITGDDVRWKKPYRYPYASPRQLNLP